MCDLYDLEPCTVWRETPRVARKRHECDGCGAVIQPRDAYVRHFDVFDGQASDEAMCSVCWFARQQFIDAHGQGFGPSYLMEALQECIGENDDDEDEWRPVLATLKRRFRASPSWARQLRRRRAEA